MEDKALRVLDKIPRDTNLYRLITILAEKCRQVSRVKLGDQRVHPINRVFDDICRDGTGEPPAKPEEQA